MHMTSNSMEVHSPIFIYFLYFRLSQIASDTFLVLPEVISGYYSSQGRPEKLRGPGQRVKVGPLTQEKKKKRSQPADNDNNYSLPITNHISLSISLLHCSFEEYCDCSIRVYRSFKQVFRGPFMGPPGAPFRLGPGAKCPSCPPPVGGPDSS